MPDLTNSFTSYLGISLLMPSMCLEAEDNLGFRSTTLMSFGCLSSTDFDFVI